MTKLQPHPMERWTESCCALYKRVGRSFTIGSADEPMRNLGRTYAHRRDVPSLRRPTLREVPHAPATPLGTPTGPSASRHPVELENPTPTPPGRALRTPAAFPTACRPRPRATSRRRQCPHSWTTAVGDRDVRHTDLDTGGPGPVTTTAARSPTLCSDHPGGQPFASRCAAPIPARDRPSSSRG